MHLIKTVGNVLVETCPQASFVKTAEKSVLLRLLHGNVNAVRKILENSVKIVENLIFLHKFHRNVRTAAGNPLREGRCLSFVQTVENNYNE